MPDPSRKAEFEALARMFKDKHEIRVLFVCGANICRSPYMELRFEQLFGMTPCHAKIISTSGGFMTSVAMHEYTRRLLLEKGIPAERIALFKPRSMRKYKEELDSVDVIIAPAREVIDSLVPRKYKEKTFLIGGIVNGRMNDIEDPVLFHDFEQYRAIIDRLDSYLAALVAIFRSTLQC